VESSCRRAFGVKDGRGSVQRCLLVFTTLHPPRTEMTVAKARKRHSSTWSATNERTIFRASGWLNGAEALPRGRARS
jgi:hypothetical protein